MKRELLCFFLFLAMLMGSVYAQERSIRGKVTSSADGTPLPGVSVQVPGSTVSTRTNDQGDFVLTVPSGSNSLRFSFLGFVSQAVNLTTSNEVNVALAPSLSELDEVVVVAYGTANRATHVGSLAQVTAAQIEDRPITNVMDALIGAAPGVQGTLSSGTPGSAPTLRIRGFGSLAASNAPLYVVDGVPYDASTVTINPEDVESISILKDASTTAMFGSRGANGVVMITTKKGKVGGGNLTLNVTSGFLERGLPEYERVNAYEYYPLMWEAHRNNLETAGIPRDVANSIASGLTTEYNGNNYSGIADLLVYNPFNVPNNQIVGIDGMINPNASLQYPEDLDWADAVTQGGRNRQNYILSYNGATDKSDYFASLGYTDEKGYLIKSRLQRFTGRINLNAQATDWLRTGLNLNTMYVDEKPDNVGGGTAFINPFFISRFIGPIYPVHLHDPVSGAYILDENGQRRYDMGDSRPYSSGRHTVWENLLDIQNDIRGTFGARTYAEVNILPELKARTNLSFDLQDNHSRSYDNLILGDGAPSGRAYAQLQRTTSYTWNQLLEYTKSFGLHNLNVLAGHENYKYKYNLLSGGRNSQIVDGNIEFPNFATVLNLTSREDNHSIESYFTRANYDFDQKYILSAAIRRDGNSRFHPDFRWENFWNMGAAYNIERESFFNVPWVDLLKVRVSYGELGNEAGLGYFPYQALYTLGRNNNTEPGFHQNSLPNDSLTWESAKNLDIGVDFTLLKGRIAGSVEYFDRVTDGLIFAVPTSYVHGGVVNSSPYYHTIDMNIGSLFNRGVEIQLTGQIVNNANFNYSATFNFTKFKNELTRMADQLPDLIRSGNHGRSVGHSIYDFHLRRFYGVDPENGDALYYTNQNTANSRIIGADTVTTIIGEADFRYTGDSAIPDFYGSMMHNLSYKGFSLSILFTYQVGGKMYDGAYASMMHGGNYGTTLHVDAFNRWQQPGDITDVPRLQAGNVADLTGASDRYLISASYLHLNNVTLNYTLPKRIVNRLGMNEISLLASGENLYQFSARQGLDVMGSFTGSVSNSYNFSRIWSFGARLKF